MSTTETATPPGEQTPPPPAETPPETGEDVAAELAKWKALAKKNEDRAKANAAAAKELETFRQQGMSDMGKAVAEAKEAGKAEALGTMSRRLLTASVKSALAGRTDVSADALLRHVDPSGLIGSDGEPDDDAIEAWLKEVAPRRAADMGQGRRGNGETPVDMNTLIRQASGRP